MIPSTDTPLDLTPEFAGSQLAPAPLAPSAAAEDPDAAADREDAFSEEPVWNGQPLHSFSIERYSLFVEQRLQMAAPRLAAALTDGHAFYPDALRILWIASQEPAILRRYRREPEAMQAAIERWAATAAPIHRCGEAVATAIRIFNSCHLNQHEARPAATPSTGHPSGN